MRAAQLGYVSANHHRDRLVELGGQRNVLPLPQVRKRDVWAQFRVCRVPDRYPDRLARHLIRTPKLK
jgi:hypothetical protein